MRKLKEGDLVTHINNDYGYFKVKSLLPKGAHGQRCQLVEVLHSTDPSFEFALIKVVRRSDLKLKEQQ